MLGSRRRFLWPSDIPGLVSKVTTLVDKLGTLLLVHNHATAVKLEILRRFFELHRKYLAESYFLDLLDAAVRQLYDLACTDPDAFAQQHLEALAQPQLVLDDSPKGTETLEEKITRANGQKSAEREEEHDTETVATSPADDNGTVDESMVEVAMDVDAPETNIASSPS